jgi:AraC-like DNA-binding protein
VSELNNDGDHSQAGSLATLEVDRRDKRIMLMTDDRVFYWGLLGKRAMSMHGGFTLYVSLGRPFTLRLDDGTVTQAMCATTAPFEPHRIMSADPYIGIIILEPESLDVEAVPWLSKNSSTAVELERVAEFVRGFYTRMMKAVVADLPSSQDVDISIFGTELPCRTLDPRIAAVVDHIRASPSSSLSADQYADNSDLSFSRFLHLFREETGVSFRRFKAWKRARAMLRYVKNKDMNLEDVALEIGYPRASYFSHSIRQFFGLNPREMFAASRRLTVMTDAAARVSG